MFLTAILEIDPSQITHIKRINNDNALFKLYDILTANVANKSFEQETFTVVSILNQIQMGLMRLGVDNVIRINVDSYDYFYDTEGKENDLFDAFHSIEQRIDNLESERFNTLELVLEHSELGIKYLIDIKINRKHKIGEFPIDIKINGAFDDLRLERDEDISIVENKMKEIFSSQENYERYIKERRIKFQTFVNEFEHTLSKFIKVDGIKLKFVDKIVRPKILVPGRREIRENNNTEPFFHGFPGINECLTYTLYWGKICSENNIYVKDFTLCDDFGKDIFAIGSEGFDSGEIDILRPQTKFKVPKIDNLIIYEGHDYMLELEENNIILNHHNDLEDSVLTNYMSLNLEIDDEDIY